MGAQSSGFRHIPFGSFVRDTDLSLPTIPFRIPVLAGILYMGAPVGDTVGAPLSIVDGVLYGLFSEAAEAGKLLRVVHYDLSPGIQFKGAFRLTGSGAYQIRNGLNLRQMIGEIETAIRERDTILASETAKEALDPLIILIDADSYDDDANDAEWLKAVFDRDLGGFALRTGVLLIAYGGKQNVFAHALGNCAPKHWQQTGLAWSGSWELAYRSYADDRRELFKKLGYAWLPPGWSEASAATDDWCRLAKAYERASTQEDLDFLSIPIGRTQSGDLLRFKLGKSSGSLHAFVVGSTGSGKTSLLNRIILGVAEFYSKDQIEIYLVDLKYGLDFQFFYDHPNCRAIFMGSNILDDLYILIINFISTFKERKKLFRIDGVKDIDSYNDIHHDAPLPRKLLIIDEVHQVFSGEWKQTEAFQKALEQVVKQGRSFGLHVILATQTLTGANISKSLLAEIHLRLAFKLVSTETWGIFPYANDEPTKLKKYEFIYNPDSGVPTANIRATALPPLDIREVLDRVNASLGDDEKLKPEIIQDSDDEDLSSSGDQEDWGGEAEERSEGDAPDEEKQEGAKPKWL